MKLLTKSQVISRKNDEERVASRQGMELAERVDGLRKQSLEEERKLTTNRQLMLSAIAEELEEARLEKQAIKDEVDLLTKARIALQKPLDDEWECLREEQATWTEKLTEIEEWKANFRAKENDLSLKMDEVNKNLQDSAELKEQARSLKEKTSIQNSAVSELSRKLSKDIENFNDYRTKETAILEQREARLNRKEVELKNKEDNLNIKERELHLSKLKHVQR